MSPPKHTLFTFRTKVRTVRLSFLATLYNFQAHATWLTGNQAVQKFYLRSARGPRLLS